MRFDRRAFVVMQQALERHEALREQVIRLSRDVLSLSKKAIYSLHREEMKTAKSQLLKAGRIISRLRVIASGSARLAATGAFAEALEEYVEASCYLALLSGKPLPTQSQLDVDIETYLQGICDLVGELVRKAVTSAARGDGATAVGIRDFVAKVHEELLLFDFRNSPARRKFDSIKYGLEKLEDLALQLKMAQRTRSCKTFK
jgi:translin